MENRIKEEQHYVLTRKRVEKISKFYKHLAIYIVVNIFLSAIFIVGDINDGDTFNEAFFDFHNYKIWIYWGIGIIFQAINTFGLSILFNKDWEKRKIEQYMNEDKRR
jgi:hypothetical protein